MCIMDPYFGVWDNSAVAKKFGHGASKSTIRSKERVPMIAPANVRLMVFVHTSGAHAKQWENNLHKTWRVPKWLRKG